MIRKTFFMAVTAIAVCLVADSAWACRFLDIACCRGRRTCVWTCPSLVPTNCCNPTTCGPAESGTTTVEKGTLLITPEQPKESPKTEVQPTPETTQPVPPAEVPAKPEKPTLPVESTPVERAVEPKPVTEPPKEPAPVTEPPKEPAPVAEPPKEPAPVAEPPKEPEPVAEPPKEPAPVVEPPKEPAAPVEAEPPKAAEPETDAFGNPVAEPPKKADEEPAAEPKAEAPKEPEKPAAPEKKEETDPFGKNDVKSYRLWTDASGEFKVNARFVGFVDGKVRLQKADGKYVRIEMNLLCMDDQRLLRQVETLAKNP